MTAARQVTNTEYSSHYYGYYDFPPPIPIWMKILVTLLILTPKTASYCPTTDADYESDEESYIDDKPPTDLPPAFDVCNINSPKQRNTVIGTTQNLTDSPQLS